MWNYRTGLNKKAQFLINLILKDEVKKKKSQLKQIPKWKKYQSNLMGKKLKDDEIVKKIINWKKLSQEKITIKRTLTKFKRWRIEGDETEKEF
jgi:hypothetical protein